MENQPKLNSSKEVIAFLAERFPQCFSAEGEARPLKVGIFQDLVERVGGEMNLSKTQLRAALRLYTSSWRYLYGVKPGAVRVDLTATRAANWKSSMLLTLVSSSKKQKLAFRRSAQASRLKSAKPPPLRVSRKTVLVVSVSHVLRFVAKKAPNSVSRVQPLQKHRVKSVIPLYQI